MKKGTFRIFAVLCLLIACRMAGTTLLAQSPQKISYQAAVRNAADLLIVSQPIGMRISILQGSAVGAVVFSETHTATTTPNGIVSIEIGGGALVSGNFATINWAAGPYFIKTETDPAGGTSYTITGTTELISVPYAFWSPTAGNTFSGDYNDLINKPVTDGSETKINGGTFVTVTGAGSSASPYVINSNPVMGGFSHYLGELFNGGIIFYLYKRSDGTEHALVVSLTESAPTLTLQNPVSDVNADSFWDGASNTAKYINSNAVTYTNGLGYGWYLPAIDELNLLWQNRYHVNRGLAAAGGTLLSDAFYWSSTEHSTLSNLAWQFDMILGSARNSQSKGSPEKVRAVRGLITTPTQLTTTAITNITNASASSGGNILSDEGSPVIARGVCWSTSPNPTTGNSHTTDGAGIGSFVSSITGLANNTTYYVRAYATNGAGTAYGNERSFTTASTVPVVTTTAISGLTKTAASSGGNVTDERGEPVTARGVCWNTAPNPTTANSITTDGAGSGVFTSSVTGLVTGTTYYLRAYATNSVGTSYGNEVSFTTLAIPTVTTSATAYTSAGNGTSGGNVTNEGGVSVTARGVCWSTTSLPTIADSKTTDGSGSGVFLSAISGLTLGTTYYVRAYATSVEGTGYGNEFSFTSLAIGDSYQGGVVATLDGTGLHGLIASSADISASSTYSNITILIGATAQSVTDGQTNTTAIIGQVGHTGGAAKLCDDYSNAGYIDWYLPARDQLITLWTNRALIGGFLAGSWWCSTEAIGTSGYRLLVAGPPVIMNFKTNLCRVRAVRNF